MGFGKVGDELPPRQQPLPCHSRPPRGIRSWRYNTGIKETWDSRGVQPHPFKASGLQQRQEPAWGASASPGWEGAASLRLLPTPSPGLGRLGCNPTRGRIPTQDVHCLRNYKHENRKQPEHLSIEGCLWKLHAAIYTVFWSREKTCLWPGKIPQNVRAKVSFYFLVLNYE